MHFIQIAAAALALPIFSMAAVIPQKRQTGNCSGFRYLAVGGISIANTDSGAGTVIVQIRPEGSTKEADWQTVAEISEGTQMRKIDYLANGPGRKNLRVCRPGIKCIEPAGDLKQWSMEQSGDRYNFELDVGRRDSDNAFVVQCDSRGRIADVATTVVTATTATATVGGPLTTVPPSSIPSPASITTTSTKAPTSTSTSTKQNTTTKSSTKTSTSVKQTATTTTKARN